MTDILETARQTGDWSIDAWWLKDNWVKVISRTPEQVHDAFEYLKHVFGPAWLRAYNGHPIENAFLRAVFYERSAFARRHLILLSECLQRLKDVKGLYVVVRGLRGRSESDAAEMELFLADHFFQEGYEIEFPDPKKLEGKSPDIRLRIGNERLAIECKMLWIGEVPAWLEGGLRAASTALLDAAAEHKYRIHFHFDPAIVERMLRLKRLGMDSFAAGERISERVTEQIRCASTHDHHTVWVWVQDCGEGCLFRSDTSVGSEIGTPPTPDDLLIKRLLRNALAPAVEQLEKENCPGIVAITCKDVPAEDYLAQEVGRFFTQNVNSTRNVLAVVILPWQGWFSRSAPRVVINHLSSLRLDDMYAARAIHQLDPIVLRSS